MRLDGYVINPFLSLAVSHVIFTGRDKQVGLLMIALNNCEGPWARRAQQVKVRFPRVALELAKPRWRKRTRALCYFYRRVTTNLLTVGKQLVLSRRRLIIDWPDGGHASCPPPFALCFDTNVMQGAHSCHLQREMWRAR